MKSLPDSSLSTSQEPAFSIGNLIPRSTARRIKAVVRAITPLRRCPACERLDETTRVLLSALVEALDQEEPARALLKALAASEGLCLPHLRQASESISQARLQPPRSFERFIAIHREKLESLRLELAEFIRKNDYRYREESFGSERDAWKRAIAVAGGERKR